jgi:hypothetical protein
VRPGATDRATTQLINDAIVAATLSNCSIRFIMSVAASGQRSTFENKQHMYLIQNDNIGRFVHFIGIQQKSFVALFLHLHSSNDYMTYKAQICLLFLA